MVAYANDSATPDVADSKTAQLQEALNEGKRSLALNDFQTAADLLSSAAQLSVEVFGEMEKGIFEPHFFYGKVLLELERIQKANLITEAIGGEANSEDCDEEEEDKTDGEDTERPAACSETASGEAGSPKASSTSNAEENHSRAKEEVHRLEGKDETDGKCEPSKAKEVAECNADEESEKSGKHEDHSSQQDAEVVEKDEAASVCGAIDKTVGESSEEANGQSSDESLNCQASTATESVEDEEDAPPLQLAWEVLEVARAVCDRNIEEDEWKEKKVEVLLVLAQCSLEGENYQQAVGDLNTCISLGQTIFEPHDRRLAEANYQAGQACCLDGQFSLAADYYTKAKNILVGKFNDLKKKLATCDMKEGERILKEYVELESLIPEVQLRIDDSRGSAEAEKLKKVAMERFALRLARQKAAKNGDASNEKTADDITMLVRKKTQKRSTDLESADDAKRSKVVAVADDKCEEA